MIDDLSEPDDCDHCGAPVLLVHKQHLVLDVQRTPTGPYTRLGRQRHPDEIATSTYHDRRDGYRRHYCDLKD